VLVIGLGAVQLAAALGAPVPSPGSGRLFRRALVPLRRRRPTTRAALLGLLTAALPCGWLYAFVLAAAGTGGAAGGALLMVAFWIGTVPMLAGVAALARPLAARLGRHRPLITAAALVVLGLAAIGLRAPMLAHGVPAASSTEAPAAGPTLPDAPPCHAVQ